MQSLLLVLWFLLFPLPHAVPAAAAVAVHPGGAVAGVVVAPGGVVVARAAAAAAAATVGVAEAFSNVVGKLGEMHGGPGGGGSREWGGFA